MAHELTNTDKIILHKDKAWHGMGIVVPEAPTVREACDIVFPWTVIQKKMTVKIDDKTYVVEGNCLNLRSDTHEQLGLVSDDYQVIQPQQMADFCEMLSEHGNVKVETAGSIRGGRRVWFLLKGDAFEIGNGDKIYPYCLVSNGFDRATAYRVTPTTIRAVCSNTLHMSIPRNDSGQLEQSAIVIRHTENAMDRIEEAKIALKRYGTVLQETKSVMEQMAAKPMTKEDCEKFFLECYTADFGDIPANPKDKYENNRRDRAMSAYASFSKRFDDEKAMAGTSAWCAFNAYSGLVQHDLKGRGKDDVARVERRVEQNLFGLNQDRTQAALQRAFQLTVAS